MIVDGETLEIDKAYWECLRKHVLNVVAECSDFSELVRKSKGAYPHDVLKVVTEFQSQGKLIPFEINSRRAVVNVKSFDILSDPHPADYDWRFFPDSITELATLSRNRIISGQKIALFGATTLFPALVDQGQATLLFNKSGSLINDLVHAGYSEGLYCQDLFLPFDQHFTDVGLVVADPPWYPDYYRAFILRASDILKESGWLYLSVLPELTRPGAGEDRKRIIEFANQCGFELKGENEALLRYESPEFEIQALKAKSINCGVWRTGDLFIFQKVRPQLDNITVSIPIDEPEWMEFVVGLRKIKVRKKSSDLSESFSFKNVDDTPILETVSRRAPQRKRIDFWTSDNVAYSVIRTDILIDALSLYQSGHIIQNIVETIKNRYNMNVVESKDLEVLLKQIK